MSDKVGQMEDRPKKLKKSFRLSDSVITSLEVLAGRRNISLSKMVEDVLSDYIDRKEEGPDRSDRRSDRRSDTSDITTDRSNDEYIAFLQDQIRVKDSQIADLQVSLNKALDTAQGMELLQLQAGREDAKTDPAAHDIVVEVHPEGEDMADMVNDSASDGQESDPEDKKLNWIQRIGRALGLS